MAQHHYLYSWNEGEETMVTKEMLQLLHVLNLLSLTKLWSMKKWLEHEL